MTEKEKLARVADQQHKRKLTFVSRVFKYATLQKRCSKPGQKQSKPLGTGSWTPCQ